MFEIIGRLRLVASIWDVEGLFRDEGRDIFVATVGCSLRIGFLRICRRHIGIGLREEAEV